MVQRFEGRLFGEDNSQEIREETIHVYSRLTQREIRNETAEGSEMGGGDDMQEKTEKEGMEGRKGGGVARYEWGMWSKGGISGWFFTAGSPQKGVRVQWGVRAGRREKNT
jgi:hypothetical protein